MNERIIFPCTCLTRKIISFSLFEDKLRQEERKLNDPFGDQSNDEYVYA